MVDKNRNTSSRVIGLTVNSCAMNTGWRVDLLNTDNGNYHINNTNADIGSELKIYS